MMDYLDSAPEVGIVGPRTFTALGKVDLSVHAPLTVSTILWQFFGFDRLFPYRMIGKYLKQAETMTVPFLVAWVQGHCFVFRRAVYEQVGGLDEALFLYNEEPDFCDRAASVGWKTAFVPQAEVTHLGSTTISRYTYVKMLYTHISMLYYFRKRGKTGAVRALKLGFVIELLMKWVIRIFQRLLTPSTNIVEKTGSYGKVIAEVIKY
jgi:GT2 family glycosyltransferase